MTALWTAADAARATGGTASRNWEAPGVSIDTRTLAPGDLFVALKGENRDGHAFVAAALERGAGAAMVSRIPEGLAEAPLLVVQDTQTGLEALGRAARARAKARIAAVTGSAGKTTTKEMLRLALSGQGEVAASAASYNNQWGVPLSLARMAPEAAFGVFEIGMNHAGEIRALVRQVRPHVAAITSVAPAHLEYFGTLEAIADAKAEIFEGVEKGGTAILPRDNPQFARLEARAREAGVANILSFGESEGADAKPIAVATEGAKQNVSAVICGTPVTFALGATGAHIVSNALAVLLAVRALGADVAASASALAGFSPLKGRGEKVSLGDVDLIDESYNANPASMTAAFGVLKDTRPKSGGRRIAVLGDMRELGPDAPALHRTIAEDIAASRTDLVFLCGPLMGSLWEALPAAQRGAYAPDSRELAPKLIAQIRPGDVILVKGSFASGMSAIIETLQSRHAAATA